MRSSATWKHRTFQLTASRRGWRWNYRRWNARSCISTHSLTKRLTSRYSIVNVRTNISTHSLTKRLTGSPSSNKLCFLISTHSLTKRLTNKIISICWIIIFQLTASRRGWRRIIECNFLSPIFQLTASRRGWPPKPLRSYLVLHFNSQPHEEADTVKILSYFGIFISTHSLTKRLTGSHKRHHWNYRHFNSQPHEEADLELQKQLSDVVVISTHSLTKRLTAILDKNTFI